MPGAGRTSGQLELGRGVWAGGRVGDIIPWRWLLWPLKVKSVGGEEAQT